MTPSRPRPDLDRLQALLEPAFAGQRGVAAAYVFGSVARGSAGSESDLDIGIVYRRREAPEDRACFAAELSAQLARATGYEQVDVIDLEAQGPIFAHGVLCEGRRVYEADAARRIDFESETIIRALDFRPTYELATRDKPKALRRWLRNRYDLRTGTVKT